jgi:hypothetical protein
VHGQLCCQRDLPGKARLSFQECLKISPRSYIARIAIGLIYIGQGDFLKAYPYIVEAVNMEPDSFKAKVILLFLASHKHSQSSVDAGLEKDILSNMQSMCESAGVDCSSGLSFFSKSNKSPVWGQAFDGIARNKFVSDKFTSLSGVIPAQLIKVLYKQHLSYVNQGHMHYQPDMKRYVISDDPMSTLVHYQLCEYVQKITGYNVIPTYTMGIHYLPGGYIKPHIDRQQNEISMSLCIGADPSVVSSPLFAKRGDEEISVILQPNDAFLYKGNEIMHYRKPVPDGETVTQVIFGYRSTNKVHCNCQ